MPKVVIKFSSPDSVSITIPDGAPVSYLAILAEKIRRGEVMHDFKLTDSCVVITPAAEGSADVKVTFGDLKFPDVQLPLLADFLNTVAAASWMQMGALQKNVEFVANMLQQAAQRKQAEAQGKRKIVLPGMMDFGRNLS